MTDSITLTCPSCGEKLQITSDIIRFACGNCGTEYVVKRGGGVVSITPAGEEPVQVKAAVDKTASELAINRLKGEIEELEREIYTIRLGVGRRYESAVRPVLWKVRKKRGVGYYIKLYGPGFPATEFAGITPQEAREMTRHISQKSLVWGRKDLLSALAATQELEKAVEKKRTQLRNHQQIVNQ
jgi:hypothetical protein